MPCIASITWLTAAPPCSATAVVCSLTWATSRAVSAPSPETADALLIALEAFHDWQVGHEETLSMFVEDNELAWLTGVPAPELR